MIQEIRPRLHRQTMTVVETMLATGDIGFAVGKDFQLTGCQFEPSIFQQCGDCQGDRPSLLLGVKGEVEMQTAAVARGADRLSYSSGKILVVSEQLT
ncbi:hypothetical protein H6F76_03170 [Leptolyngbya sp. FACHB-321]|uniref:hypothetical protein n=1 Tax=Leptolyngbya sp. FACHB-321 TaxID=2692807 RepID=UPI0016857B0C|nr:hypothetical protein [Leptolyngbya sp. FACHB-321]MBD2034051.1 hypothetical protein [Leptolyngbya sp. FACHB-321]